jgi:hypothetical protein
MGLHTPAQVLSRIPGLSTRELIDMTEKGLIIPAEESTGQGSPRQYSDENVFQIAVAASLRKTLPPKVLKMFMENDFKFAIENDILVFRTWPNDETKRMDYSVSGINTDSKNALMSIFHYNMKNRSLKGFLTIILNVKMLREYLGL